MTPSQELDLKIKILEQFHGFNSSLVKILAEETSPSVTLQMLTEFSKTVSTEAQEIEKALFAKNNLQLKKSFHKLAGTSELLGFPNHGKRWRTLSNELEKGLSFAELPAELDEVKNLHKILAKAMSRNTL